MPFTPLDPTSAEAAFATTAGAPLTSVGETLLDFRTELAEQIGNRDDVDQPRLDKWINWAYRNVAGMLRTKELEASAGITLVLNQPFYLLPEAVQWIKLAALEESALYPAISGGELEMIDAAVYRTLLEEEGDPRAYFRWQRMLVLYPTPTIARVLTLDFRIRPADLADDTDSPMLPQETHEAILLSARHRAFRSLRMYKEAQMAMNDFLVTIRPLLDADAEETDAQHGTQFAPRTKSDLYRGRI